MFGIDDAIIGGGMSLLGGLFGGKKKQKTTSSVDYVKMRKSAEAAGFNPLTALQNGGAAGFSTSVTSGGGLSAFEALSNAFGVYQSMKPDPVLEKNKVLQNQLLEKELGGHVSANGSGLSSSRAVANGVVASPASYAAVSRSPLSSSASKTFGIWEKARDRPADVLALTTQAKTGLSGGEHFQTLNPDAMDIDIWELMGAGLVHGAGWLLHNQAKAAKQAKSYKPKIPSMRSPRAIVSDRFGGLSSW